ncbi:MAG: XRE family transcriptional regulator [Gammaproteobacteria bacterium]|nr:XRE family transcriptional regulator [Gammaproteobacteria bacterium]
MFDKRLRLARKRAGLSMRALADQLSPRVTVQAISKYESGKMMPSSSVLVGLGKTLGVSLDFLMGGQVNTLQGIEFRKRSGISAQNLAKAEAIVIERLEDYLAIEDIIDLAPQDNPFGSLVTGQIESFAEIDDIANGLRRHWRLGINPIPSMTGLLEEKGIRVIEANLPQRFDGLTCDALCSGERPVATVVVVSSQTGIERKRFNLAHELAHQVIRATGNPEIRLEKAVDRFAGAFLVPFEHLATQAGERRHGITYHELMQLKRLYGVSASAMLMRLGQVGILPKSTIEHAFRSYARPWRREEPEPIREDEGFGFFERPTRFENLVWRALAEQLISPVRAAQLLHLPLSSIEREIRGPDG